MPTATHMKCARHIYANMRNTHPGKVVHKYFWIACKAYNEGKFNWAMNKLRDARPAAYRWLMEIPLEMWDRHKFDRSLKNDHVTSNVAESFNAWIGEFRGKPVYECMDGIRAKLMVRMQEKKEEGLHMVGSVCPATLAKLWETWRNLLDAR